MDARQERGLVIAALCKLNSGERICRVSLSAQTCSCPDHREGGFKCKHVYAAEYTMRRPRTRT
jgi:hypothetical protein